MSNDAGTVECATCGSHNPASNRFCGTCGSRLESGHPAGHLPEERRWATVLFVDVAGFTSMSERMDPEDVGELARSGIRIFAEQISRFGGTVLREIGDEVLAVFGAPAAHEDDPERAVRAGLAIRDAPLSGPDGQALRVHVGINTGEILVTRINLGSHEDYTVHGDAVNTAARLRAVAAAGTVLVGEETYRASRHVVRYQENEPIVAKGKELPVPVWEALDVAEIPVARPSRSGPLVGREEELRLLSGIWAKVCRDGRPHLVTILGDPGIGKSRLVRELESSTLSQVRTVHGRCPPYGEVAGYWPLAMALREAAGIASEDGPEVARARLQALVQHVAGGEGAAATADEMLPALAVLIGIDGPRSESQPSMDQPTLYAGMRRFLESFARSEPLVVILDDIHWADDALLDAIEFLAARLRDVPLLLLTQARPELLDRRPTWGRGVRSFSSVSLEPLDPDSVTLLIAALSAQHGIALPLAEQVGQGAGGNPLFAEELVSMLAERGGTSHVPSAIKALISARIDALSVEERTVLQRAAVFGRACWTGGLRALSAPEPLEDHLEALEYKDLLRGQPRSRFPGESEYTFKHDLIREVAFDMLLRSERRAAHGRIVDWIESTAAERSDEYLDLLAHHAVEAGQAQRAIHYLIKTGERVRQTAAHRSEAALLSQALDIARTEGDRELATELLSRRGRAFVRAALWQDAHSDLGAALHELPDERIEQRAEILVDLAAADMWAYGSEEARPIAERTLTLLAGRGRPDLVAGAMTYLATNEAGLGDPIAGLEIFGRAYELVRESNLHLRDSTLQGATMYSIALYWTGRNDEAIRVGHGFVAEMRDRNESVARMLALPHLGLALAAKGEYGEAVRVFDEARRFGRDYEIWGPLARATSMSAGFHLELSNFARHRELTEEAREIGQARFPPTLAFTGVDLLLNAARRGEPGEVERSVDGVQEEVARATAWHRWLSTIRLYEARAELALARGDADTAIRWATDTIEKSRSTHRLKYEALGLETRAAAFRQVDRITEAIADLHRAVEVARGMGDPALFVRVSAPLLELDGDDRLAAEAGNQVERILASLPEDAMRAGFEAEERVRIISRLAPRALPPGNRS